MVVKLRFRTRIQAMETERTGAGCEAGGVYTDIEAQHIVEVLDRKRKALDDEIARFRAQKEEEYRLFEKTFKSIIVKSVREDNPRTRNVGDGGNQAARPAAYQNLFEGPASVQERTSEYPVYRENSRRSELSRSLQEASMSGLGAVKNNSFMRALQNNRSERLAHHQVPFHSQGRMEHGTHGRTNMSLSPNSSSALLQQGSHIQERGLNTQSRQHTHPHHPEGQSLTHARELEFRGLFTPHFLPLLESTGRSAEPTGPNSEPQSIRRENESPIHAPPNDLKFTTLQSTPLTSRTSTNSPHSSLPKDVTSITNLQHLSSSVPARSPPSSSAALHSSIRTPTTKKPRSPKRVFFEIDNVVVPPSSTPPPKAQSPPIIYAMPWPTEEVSPPREHDPAAKASKLAVANAKEEGAAKEGERRWSKDLGHRTVPGQHGKNPAAITTTTSSAHGEPAKKAEPAPTTTRSPAGVDDDDEDNMFLLDEEIAAKKVWHPPLLYLPTDKTSPVLKNKSCTNSPRPRRARSLTTPTTPRAPGMLPPLRR